MSASDQCEPDCSYVRASEFGSIPIFSDPELGLSTYPATGVDTTTGNSHCAYDRFTVTPSINGRIISHHVFHFNIEYMLSSSFTSDVSDHFPIELVIEGMVHSTMLRCNR